LGTAELDQSVLWHWSSEAANTGTPQHFGVSHLHSN